MHKILSFILLFSASATVALGCPCEQIKVPEQQPPDVSFTEGLKFSRTASWKKEFTHAVHSGKEFCTRYMREHPNAQNLAIVCDIDETLLDNRDEYARHPNFDWSWFSEWAKSAHAPVLRPTADFLRWARRQGFAIFLVTGRTDDMRAATIRNLVRENVAYDGLSLRPVDDKGPVENYKSHARKSIEDGNFRIVCNIGDQYSDLAGGYSLDCEKLPNRMYFIK